MGKAWFNDSASADFLSAPDDAFPDGGFDVTISPLWGAGVTMERILLWWDVRWFTRVHTNFSPEAPPIAHFEIDVIDTEFPTPPDHALGQLGVGQMSSYPTANVTFSDSNLFFDAFRMYQGSSGAQPIDLRGSRTGNDFVGQAQLRIRVDANNNFNHPEGWIHTARFSMVMRTSVLLVGPSVGE